MKIVTFAGTLDDAVERSPFGFSHNVFPETAVHTLLRHALFGNPIVIHSGFLFHNAQLRSMVETQNPLLMLLLEYGRVIVLSQSGDIISDEEIKIQAGVPTSQFRGISDSDRRMYGTISAKMDLRPRHGLSGDRSWVRNSEKYEDTQSSARFKMLRDICTNRTATELALSHVSEKEFETVAQSFLSMSVLTTPRSAWEFAVTELVGREHLINSPKARELMDVAHEVFHVGQAFALSRDFKGHVRLETIYTNRLNAYVRFNDEAPNSGEASYTVSIPTELVMGKLESFLDDLYDEDAKLCFARNAYLASHGSELAAKLYEDAIYAWFGIPTSPDERVEEIKLIGATGGAAGAYLFDVAMERWKNQTNESNFKAMSRRHILRTVLFGLAGVASITVFQPTERIATLIARRVANSEFKESYSRTLGMIESDLPSSINWPYHTRGGMPTIISSSKIDFEMSNVSMLKI